MEVEGPAPQREPMGLCFSAPRYLANCASLKVLQCRTSPLLRDRPFDSPPILGRLPVTEAEDGLRVVGTLCEPSHLRAGGVSQARCNSSLGERALGCGRWNSALTEPFRLYVRSLTRAPLGRSVK